MELVEKVPLKQQRNRIHPHKYALWVACASIVMMFAALTSAYMVRKSGGNWLEFTIPNVFYYNTVVILISSIVIHASYLAYNKAKMQLFRMLLGTAAILGVGFIVLQYVGWQHLIAQGIELKTNPSSSFLYVISGLHAVHVLGGVVAILIAFTFAITTRKKVTPRGRLKLELVVHYWHFVDFLWVYLFVFLLIQ